MPSDRPSLFAELRKRKVFRAAGVYACVAWAVLEFCDVAFPALGLPDWTITLTLMLALLGFPIALVLAWAFDLEPDGLKRAPSSDEASEAGSSDPADEAKGAEQGISLFRVAELSLIAVLVGAVGYLYFVRLSPANPFGPSGVAKVSEAAGPVPEEFKVSAKAEARKPSIGVLPFVNMSQDPENEYFSDGVSEEILDALANLGTIQVAARTSSFSFKGRNEDIREIGMQLAVDTLLEGSVRKSGNQVRITAQLINTSTGYHLWSQTFDRVLSDIFVVQDEIAMSIVKALQVPLGLEPDQALVDTGTSNPEAYNAYLRGLHHFKQIGPDTFEKTIASMKQAIELDPDFAAPYGNLASTYLLAALWMPREEAFPAAKAAFDRALELDPSSGVALLAKAQYITLSEWDWAAARENFDLALQDKGNATITAIAYATLHLAPLGQLDEANQVLADAEKNDPLDPRIKLVNGSLALFSGDVRWATAQYQLSIDLDPDSVPASSALCLAYAQSGDIAGADALMSDWEERLGYVHPWFLSCEAYLNLGRGKTQAALSSFARLKEKAAAVPGLAFFAGDVALALGRTDEAISWYERSLAEGEIGILMTRLRHATSPALNANPRYQALLRTMHLDDASLAQLSPLVN